MDGSMEPEVLSEYSRFCSRSGHATWMKSLDPIFVDLRKHFVFDNLAIYKKEEENGQVEAIYARAIGRGRSKEADVPWGDALANQVMSMRKPATSVPESESAPDREAMPFLMGIPLEFPSGQGALIFVRFGGPKYTAEQYPWAFLAASLVGQILEQVARVDAQDQLDSAQRRTQLQDDFIATISHEVHTPLGFIKGYTTSLLRPDAVWDMATQREFLTIIDEETDQLVMLIDRMLDSARLQSGTMAIDLQPVRMEVLLKDVIMRTEGRYKAIEFHATIPVVAPIQADVVRISQVVSNLFDNAIKYAPGSPIAVTLEENKDAQVITIADQGPGIPAEYLPYLFDRFFRVPNNMNKRGTGLGLFICKQIILAHQGHISVRTVPGNGTSFRIELPVRARGENPER